MTFTAREIIQNSKTTYVSERSLCVRCPHLAWRNGGRGVSTDVCGRGSRMSAGLTVSGTTFITIVALCAEELGTREFTECLFRLYHHIPTYHTHEGVGYPRCITIGMARVACWGHTSYQHHESCMWMCVVESGQRERVIGIKVPIPMLDEW